jgi:circadian clock protein KaiC
MNHSNQIREFHITDHGIELRHPYIGMGGVVTGTARYIQEARDQAEMSWNELELQELEHKLDTLRKNNKSRMREVQSDFVTQETDLIRKIALIKTQTRELKKDEEEMSRARGLTSNRPKGRQKTVAK